jgi:sulfur carrier protein ThiS
VKINVQLFSILRDKLPPEAKGRVALQLEDGSTLADVLDDLEITRKVVISVNGVQETDRSRKMNEGDQVKILLSISGG